MMSQESRTRRAKDDAEGADDDDILKGAADASWGARVGRIMAAVGFAPRPALYPSHVEYAKAYADPEGRTARVTAVIAKGSEGVTPSRLESFVLTVQCHIPATMDMVERAPAYLRGDLLAIVGGLGGADEEVRRDVIALDCAACGDRTSEFYVDKRNGKSYCPTCFRKPR